MHISITSHLFHWLDCTAVVGNVNREGKPVGLCTLTLCVNREIGWTKKKTSHLTVADPAPGATLPSRMGSFITFFFFKNRNMSKNTKIYASCFSELSSSRGEVGGVATRPHQDFALDPPGNLNTAPINLLIFTMDL